MAAKNAGEITVTISGNMGNDPIMKDKGTPQEGVTIKAPIPRIGVKGLGKEQLSSEARRSFSAKRSSSSSRME